MFVCFVSFSLSQADMLCSHNVAIFPCSFTPNLIGSGGVAGTRNGKKDKSKEM
jgi:hypothetical protein